MNIETSHFANTGILLDLDNGRAPFRPVTIPSETAKSWDGALPATNCAVFSVMHEVHCYAELKITGRRVRKHTGGTWGIAARVRFTSVDDTGEWFDCVVVDRGWMGQ